MHAKVSSSNKYLLGIENFVLFLFAIGLIDFSAPFLLNKLLIYSYRL